MTMVMFAMAMENALPKASKLRANAPGVLLVLIVSTTALEVRRQKARSPAVAMENAHSRARRQVVHARLDLRARAVRQPVRSTRTLRVVDRGHASLKMDRRNVSVSKVSWAPAASTNVLAELLQIRAQPKENACSLEVRRKVVSKHSACVRKVLVDAFARSRVQPREVKLASGMESVSRLQTKQ